MNWSPLFSRAQRLNSPLPALLVRAVRVADTVAQGFHGRRRKGVGDHFWQYRPYQSGESTQHIDWRQSAKSQQYFVREKERDVAQTVWLWRDSSASMHYQSAANYEEKIDRADVLLLALACLLVRGGERIGFLGDDMPPMTGQSALYRMLHVLEKHHHSESLHSLPAHEHLPRYGELILIGDFLSPLDDLHPALKRYSRRHVRGHLLQVLDPAEETLPFTGRVHFKGLEQENSRLIDNVDQVRSAYQDRLQDRRHALQQLAHALGWSFHRHRTDQSSAASLLALYQSLSHRGRA